MSQTPSLPPIARVLWVVRCCGPITGTDLAARAVLPLSDATDLLYRLLDGGLVCRSLQGTRMRWDITSAGRRACRSRPTKPTIEMTEAEIDAELADRGIDVSPAFERVLKAIQERPHE